MTNEEKLERICQMFQITRDRKVIAIEIMQWHKEEMKKLVPEGKPIPMVSLYDCGYNKCRNEILRAIEENV